MTLKTSDLCDACDEAQACALAFRGWGQRRAFAGNIRTIRCHEDIALMRDAVCQPGHGNVLVIDGGGSMARALFGDVMAANASRNGWAQACASSQASHRSEVLSVMLNPAEVFSVILIQLDVRCLHQLGVGGGVDGQEAGKLLGRAAHDLTAL